MTHTQTTYTNRIALCAGKKGAHPAEVGALASVFEKSATELKRSKLLKCKQTLQIATFNVRTLYRIGQVPELIASAEEHKIDIICIQEHRYTHTEDIKYHETGNGWSLVTVSAWKNSVNAAVGGVGLLIGPRALKTLNSIEKIQPRMMAATFNGNPRATIISCYSPTNVSEETELVTFYDELSSLVRSIPKHNMLVIGGDMNAQIGKNGNNKYSLHNTSNRNGQHVTDFMTENRLACLNTNYQKREGKLWTYTYANNTKAQIDYVLINKKWKNSAMNCEAYSSFEGVSKKGDLGLAKNYRGITLTSIATKIYNALLRNRIEPKIDNILRKNQNGFWRNRSTTSQILTIRRILEGVRAKNLQATLIFVDFTKTFDSIHRGKMEQIQLAYGIPKDTVAAITILYRNTKVKVRSPDGDTEYFDIVAGVLQGDTLASYLFIICLDYVLRISIDKIRENDFELTKKRSRRYPATTITDADYADDIAILANTPDQAETLLHSLERAAASIGLYVNAHKTEYMCYNQKGDISTLEGTPLKLVDKFTYLGSSVSSTEKDIETRLTKAWTAINRLSIIWKSDLTDKMKRSFFQAAVRSILLYGCTTWTLTKRLEKKLDGNYTRMLRAILNKSWRQHLTRYQLYGHLPPITKTIQVRRTRHAGHCWRSRGELIRDVLLWTPTHSRAKAGRPARTTFSSYIEDMGCCPEDLPRAMNDREEWRERVRDIRATSAIWWWWWWWWLLHCGRQLHKVAGSF